MQESSEKYCFFEENSVFKVSIYSVIGDRSEQQDSVGIEMDETNGMIVVCDGMGGFENGSFVSQMAVKELLEAYRAQSPLQNVSDFFLHCVSLLDERVSSLSDESGRSIRAGSTLSAVYIDNNHLHWVSVGDSRIYIFRNGELIQITNDQNYFYVLNKQLEAGIISEEEYAQESSRGEGLISFLGVGGLPVIDYNARPFGLMSEDQILIMSDGLYKLVPDSEVCSIISNFSNVSEALEALDLKAKKLAVKKNITRDNMSLALIKIK